MDSTAPVPTGESAGASSAAPKLVPFGKYLLLERVAVGGMAEVWLAKRVEGDGVSDLLAVKRILPQLSADAEFVKMFVDEARIAGQLQHPGIVPMHELGRIGQTFYISMEFVWGRDLLQLLRTIKAAGEKFSFAAAAYVGARVCEALHYAHVKVDKSGKPLELVHRDVSPQNVLLSFDGKVKLIDFGIAKAASRTTKTQAGTLKGKVGYMSPEQVRGLPIDARSDLFAVGTLLYEMLTVRPLFARGNNFEAMNRVRDANVPPIASRVPDIPPALAEIVTKALRREAADRYANAQEMQRALTVFLAEHVSSFERIDLATWLRALYADEFAREKARLDALDSIGRPAVAPVAKKHANPVTSLEIAATSLFDSSFEDDEEATVVGEQPFVGAKPADAASEVFFHRNEVVQVGEANPEGHAPRPLTALFRPGKALATDAYRPPLVGREDNPEARAPVSGHAPSAPAVVVSPASVPVASVPVASVPVASVPVASVPVASVPIASVPVASVPVASVPVARGSIPPPRAALDAKPRGTLAPPQHGSSAVPPPRTSAAPVPRPASMRPPARAPAVTAPFGLEIPKAPLASERTEVAEPPARITQPHHPPSSRPPVPPPSSESTPIEVSASFLSVSSVEVAPELGPVVHETSSLRAPTLVRRAVEPEDDETFDDGGIREPLVRPVVSRARIVAVSDRPPAPVARILPPRGPLAEVPTQPGTVPLVSAAGDTPSTSAITQALEQMAKEQRGTTGSGPIAAVETDPGRVSGFALDPQQLNSQIIREILPKGTSSEPPPPSRKGEPTEPFTTGDRGSRVAHVPMLLPRATTADYAFFVLAALLTVALGATASAAVLFADSSAALEVHCVPSDVVATVIVDGRPRGRAPVRIEDLEPGPHSVTLVAPGFREAQRAVVISPRESASIEVALIAARDDEPSAPLPSGVLPPPAGEAAP